MGSTVASQKPSNRWDDKSSNLSLEQAFRHSNRQHTRLAIGGEHGLLVEEHDRTTSVGSADVERETLRQLKEIDNQAKRVSRLESHVHAEELVDVDLAIGEGRGLGARQQEETRPPLLGGGAISDLAEEHDQTVLEA